MLNYLALHGEEAMFGTVLNNPRLGGGSGRGALHRVQPNRLTERTKRRRAVAPTRARTALAALVLCSRARRAAASSTTLVPRSDASICRQCGTRFPLYKNGGARIPWLFRDPDGALLEWRARFNGYLHASS